MEIIKNKILNEKFMYNIFPNTIGALLAIYFGISGALNDIKYGFMSTFISFITGSIIGYILGFIPPLIICTILNKIYSSIDNKKRLAEHNSKLEILKNNLHEYYKKNKVDFDFISDCNSLITEFDTDNNTYEFCNLLTVEKFDTTNIDKNEYYNCNSTVNKVKEIVNSIDYIDRLKDSIKNKLNIKYSLNSIDTVPIEPLSDLCLATHTLSVDFNNYNNIYIKDNTDNLNKLNNKKLIENYIETLNCDYKILFKNRINVNNKIINIDNILLTNEGIFIIKTLNFNFKNSIKSIKFTNDCECHICYENGSDELLSDILKEFNLDIYTAEKFLNLELKNKGIYKDITLIPILIIPNKDIKFYNKSCNPIIYIDTLISEFHKYNFSYPDRTLNELCSILTTISNSEDKFETINISEKCNILKPYLNISIKLLSEINSTLDLN